MRQTRKYRGTQNEAEEGRESRRRREEKTERVSEPDSNGVHLLEYST